MTEHPSSQVLEQYAGRTLSPDDFLSVHQHVSSCPVCAAHESATTRAEDYSNLLTALMPSAEDEPYHLSAEELSSYVDDTLDEIDRENALSHIEVCNECRAKAAERQTSPAAGWWKVHVLQSRPVQIAALVLLTLAVISFVVWRARNRHEPLQAPLQNGPQPPQSVAAVSPSPLESQPEVVLSLQDGGREIRLNKNGELEGLEHLSPALQKTIKAALVNQALEKPADLEELKGKESVLLGGGSEGRPFELTGPIASVLLENQPTFRWRPLEGATGYVVAVLDAQLDEVATSEVLTTLEWRIPKKLSGGIYSWQVTAIKDGQRIVSPVLPAPEAKFKILDSRSVSEIARARRGFPNSHLVLGVVYAKAGLIEEARRELTLLQKLNPQAPIVVKLLDQLR
jgi:hypothetical protein